VDEVVVGLEVVVVAKDVVVCRVVGVSTGSAVVVVDSAATGSWSAGPARVLPMNKTTSTKLAGIHPGEIGLGGATNADRSDLSSSSCCSIPSTILFRLSDRAVNGDAAVSPRATAWLAVMSAAVFSAGPDRMCERIRLETARQRPSAVTCSETNLSYRNLTTLDPEKIACLSVR
jgi:hypothetical protein